MNASRCGGLGGGDVAATKKLVCLANSRKHGGRCVAGIEVSSNSWIRPVSGRPGHEVSAAERQYPSGAEPRLLDIVSMRLIEPKPIDFHRENWLVDSTVRWQKEGQIGWDDLCLLEESSLRLWRNGYHTNARAPSSSADERVVDDQGR
ncbi:dual OB domain-containing protein [Streptomyces marianii]|uniref:dual OB domain-containing protein n=1 Tax=Streptomyces marianii TaxID=1817406 RepID=UPI00389A9E43